MLSRLRTRLAEERGMALVLALGILVALSATSMALLQYTTANQGSAVSSKSGQVSFALAEAGMNNALAVLFQPNVNVLNAYLFCPPTNAGDPLPTLPCKRTTAYEGGEVEWWGVLTTNAVHGTAHWALTSIGSARTPAGQTPRRRTMTAIVPVKPAEKQPLNSEAWNYVYSRQVGTGQAFNGCDMRLTNSVQLRSPLYVNGNLCVGQSAMILGESKEMWVRGSLTLESQSNAAGSLATPLQEAHIAKGCKYWNNAANVPCKWGAGSSGNSNVWANVLDSAAGEIEPPSVLWDHWYLHGNPGPYYPCGPRQTGDPPHPTFVFDNPVAPMTASDATKLTYRNNNAGLINLTPGTSYKCKTFSGELSWDFATKTLTISGTMYIDGSAKIDNGFTNRYVGQGVIYMSGTLLIKNSKLCAVLDGSNCTTEGWNPNERLLVFVTDGRGANGAPDSQVSSTLGIQVVSSHVQSAMYATHVIEVGTTSIVDGPLDGLTVVLGQTSNSSFPPFTWVPDGMPGNEAVLAVLDTPQISFG